MRTDPVNGYPDLAHRDEYLEQKLCTAACVIWLSMSDPLTASDPLDPNDQWIASEADGLRTLLSTPETERPAGRYWELRWYVLRLLGIVQSYAANSQAREQRPVKIVPDDGPNETEPDREANPIREWIYGGVRAD